MKKYFYKNFKTFCKKRIPVSTPERLTVFQFKKLIKTFPFSYYLQEVNFTFKNPHKLICFKFRENLLTAENP